MILGELDVTKAIGEMSQVQLKRGIQNAVSVVQGAAKALCPVHDGELRGNIFADVEEQGSLIRGICYTNKSYAAYVEFGTGPKGQAHHEGISPDAAVAYTQSPWWIHEGSGPNEIDRRTAERYHFLCVETDQGRFYRCTGQAAQPFMYPALKNNEDAIVKIIKREAMK